MLRPQPRAGESLPEAGAPCLVPLTQHWAQEDFSVTWSSRSSWAGVGWPSGLDGPGVAGGPAPLCCG